MIAYTNLKGERFGRLIVLEFSHTDKNRKAHWRCMCDCGKEIICLSHSLRNRRTRSCGCFKIDKATKHGMKRTRIYGIWGGMIKRCTNPKSTRYKNYGGRGIEVCHSWRDAATFIAWAQTHGYQDNLTIDRIDNDGNYEPGNCHWISGGDNVRKSLKARYDLSNIKKTNEKL